MNYITLYVFIINDSCYCKLHSYPHQPHYLADLNTQPRLQKTPDQAYKPDLYCQSCLPLGAICQTTTIPVRLSNSESKVQDEKNHAK